MNKKIILGVGTLIGASLTGCSKQEISQDNSNEDISIEKVEEVDLSSNLEKARNEYVEGEKPLYIDGILVVNKEFGIPRNYAPSADEEALRAYEKMKADAKEDGIVINIRSGHRTTETQEILFNNYAKRDGIEKANRYSAKPGHSEHETGLTFDFTTEDTVTSIGDWFTETPQAKWLYENAYKYGFILRYPKDKEHITGYKYESWHYRYIGTEHSKNFAMNDLTLEEYLKIVDPTVIK